MEKALEVLRRELQNNYEKRPFIIKRELYHKEKIEDFHEAIDELQDLKSRSCEGCKHFSTGKQPDGFSWYKCEHNFECRRCFPDNFERLEK